MGSATEDVGIENARRKAVRRQASRVRTVLLDLLRDPRGFAGIFMLGGIVFISLAAPYLAPYDPKAVGVGQALQSPSAQHLFGTDDLGRDVLSRFLYGGRISLLVGVLSGVIATLVATIIGIPAGYFRGRVGRWLTTGIDISLVFPPFILVIVLAAYVGSNIVNIILILALLSWPIPARTIKSKSLSVRENEFVESTEAIGASHYVRMKDEVLPNVLPVIFANGVLQIVFTILMEAAISFLGLGDPSTISWGTMLYFAQKQGALSVGAWWWTIFPGLGIVATAFGFTLLGTALDKVLNPRLQRRTWGGGDDTGSVSEQPTETPSSPSVSDGGTDVLDSQAEPGSFDASAATFDDTTVLEVNGLTTHYETDDGFVRAANNVSFTVDEGEVFGLVGESGCGKTTVGMSLLRALPPQGRIVAGELMFDGQDLTTLTRKEMKKVQWKDISMIYQGAMDAFNPVKTIGNQIEEPLRKHDVVPADEREERVRELLSKVNLDPSVAEQYPHQLSGGMKQRAAIAMAISCEPKLLIADEPTTALDVVVQGRVLDMLKNLQEEFGFGMVVISHDLSTIMKLADEIGVMYAGNLVERTTAKNVYRHPKHPYSAQLFSSIIDPHRPPKQVESIPGDPPDLRNPPDGCPFAERCSLATEECYETDPVLSPVEGGHSHLAACFHSDQVEAIHTQEGDADD